MSQSQLTYTYVCVYKFDLFLVRPKKKEEEGEEERLRRVYESFKLSSSNFICRVRYMTNFCSWSLSYTTMPTFYMQ